MQLFNIKLTRKNMTVFPIKNFLKLIPFLILPFGSSLVWSQSIPVTSTYLQQLSQHVDAGYKWFYEHTQMSAYDPHPNTIYETYVGKLSMQALEQKTWGKKNISEDIRIAMMRNACLDFLAIFEKTAEQYTQTDKKIMLEHKQHFDASMRSILSAKGAQEYKKNPEEFARQMAETVLVINIASTLTVF